MLPGGGLSILLSPEDDEDADDVDGVFFFVDDLPFESASLADAPRRTEVAITGAEPTLLGFKEF